MMLIAEQKPGQSRAQALYEAKAERWQGYREESPGDAMIYADGTGGWFGNLGCLYDHCAMCGLEPAAMLPVVGVPHRLETPDLADYHSDDADDNGELPDFISEAQTALNEIYARSEYRWFHVGDSRPDGLMTLAQIKAEARPTGVAL